jgi:hypothetical protein
VKNDAAQANVVAERLSACNGVVQVVPKPLTGSVIVTYRPDVVSEATLLNELTSVCGGPVVRLTTTSGHRTLADDIARAVLKSAVETAVQRAILALI